MNIFVNPTDAGIYHAVRRSIAAFSNGLSATKAARIEMAPPATLKVVPNCRRVMLVKVPKMVLV